MVWVVQVTCWLQLEQNLSKPRSVRNLSGITFVTSFTIPAHDDIAKKAFTLRKFRHYMRHPYYLRGIRSREA